jgi:hypothetical protein
VSSLSFFSVDGEPIKDEYDPSKPNDYEAIREQREKKRRDAEEEAERQAKLREIEQVGYQCLTPRLEFWSICSSTSSICACTSSSSSGIDGTTQLMNQKPSWEKGGICHSSTIA